MSVSGAISTVDTGFSVKPSAPASRSYSSGSISPSPRDSSTRAATSSRVYVERDLVHEAHPEQPQDRRRDGVDHHDDGTQHGDDAPDRRAQDERGPVGAGQRDVLGDHLAQHDVQVDHDRQRDHERDRVQQRLRHVQRRASTGSTRCATAGSPTAPSTSEQTVMPSWLTPITSDMFSIARQRGPAIREPASARGSIWVRRAETSANSAPTKNALPSSSSAATSERGPAAHDAPPPRCPEPAPLSGSSSRSVSRSMRSPSMCSTVSVTSRSRGRRSSRSEVGDGDLGDVATLEGTRPSTWRTRPGDGVVVLALRQGDAGEVLDLVGAQQPGEQPGAVAARAGPGRRGGRARRRCPRRSPRSRPRGSRSRRARRTRRGRRRAGSRPCAAAPAAGPAAASRGPRSAWPSGA